MMAAIGLGLTVIVILLGIRYPAEVLAGATGILAAAGVVTAVVTIVAQRSRRK
jgi:hypothetical protein